MLQFSTLLPNNFFVLAAMIGILTSGSSFAQTEPNCSLIPGTVIHSVDFGSGLAQISATNPEHFGFITTYDQKFEEEKVNDSMFAFENKLRDDFGVWEDGLQDHTSEDGTGYMMVVNGDFAHGEYYRDTLSELCVGASYHFSAFLKNIFLPQTTYPVVIKPNVRFELREIDGTLVKVYNTGTIESGSLNPWIEYGVSFVAPSQRLVFLLISDAEGGIGNDLAIDDITVTAGQLPTQVDASFTATQLLVYPNPARKEATISLTGQTALETISISDMLGKEVFNIKTDGQMVVVPLQDFERGIYMINVRSVQGIVTKRLVVE